MSRKSARIETQAVHAGEPQPRIGGAVVMPVFQSSTFEYGGGGGYHDLRYIRLNNTPNHFAVQEKLAALEGAEAALVTGSGMAAISTTLLTLLKPGDRLLAQRCLYGGTYDLLVGELAELGIATDFFDGDDAGAIERLKTPATRAVYVEALSNPLLEVPDLTGIARSAKAHGLVSIIDSTFASPINLRALGLGYDLVIHSCTKYLNGHSDLVAGAVVGGRERVDAITKRLNHLGGCLNPEACALLHRGMKTLALRVRAQNQGASVLAEALAKHPAVKRVHYPGLTTHPGHARARELFQGFGGMLSFELEGGLPAAEAFLGKVTIPLVAPSLGGVETLVIRPAASSHAGMGAEERARLGITDGLVRVSVGIEAPDDLIADFEHALSPG